MKRNFLKAMNIVVIVIVLLGTYLPFKHFVYGRIDNVIVNALLIIN